MFVRNTLAVLDFIEPASWSNRMIARVVKALNTIGVERTRKSKIYESEYQKYLADHTIYACSSYAQDQGWHML